MPIRSYVRSTDYHRKPCGENILCGINVSVMVRSTFWTIPLPNIKRQFINNMTAVPTALRARKPTVNFYQCSTVPLALVFQQTNQLRPTGISDCLSQFVVLHHVLHRQVLDSNRLIFTYQSSRQLVFAKRPEGKEICSGIGNSGMNSGNLVPCFLSIAGAFNFTRECFLSLPQLISKTLEMLGVGNLLSVASSKQRGDSHVNPYRFINLRQGFNGMVIDQQGDEPTPRCIQPHCDRRRFTLLRKNTTPANRQRLGTFCQPQLPILPLTLCLRCPPRKKQLDIFLFGSP